jgi:hypothetical protein
MANIIGNHGNQQLADPSHQRIAS